MALKISFQTLLYHTVLPTPATYDLRTDDLRWCLGIVSNILSILRTLSCTSTSLTVNRNALIVYCQFRLAYTICLPACSSSCSCSCLSVDSIAARNRKSASTSSFAFHPISPSHHPCIHKIGLCFFARLMAPFSRLRRVPLRTHPHTHYPLGFIVLCLFSFFLSLFFQLCMMIANGAYASYLN